MDNKSYHSFADIPDMDMITVIDKDNNNEEKQIKPVSRAAICTTMAFLTGINDDVLEKYYSHNYNRALKALFADKNAKIIRYLSRIRTTLFKHYKEITADLNRLINIDRMSYFNPDEIKELENMGVNIVKANYTVQKYMFHVQELIEKYISNCKNLFPERVNFTYIKSLFIIDNYRKEKANTIWKQCCKFNANKKSYPFQMYVNLNNIEQVNFYLFYDDVKFLKLIYKENHDEFNDAKSFFSDDVAEEKKVELYSMINKCNNIEMIVDCENSNPFKLFATLKGLREEEIKLISKIVLVNDVNTTFAWDHLCEFIKVPIEHIVVERISDNKSLVDFKVIMHIQKNILQGEADAFILVASDSDFGILMQEYPQIPFVIFYEKSKCGHNIKKIWEDSGALTFAMDDFYLDNDSSFKKEILLKALELKLPTIIGKTPWAIAKEVYYEAKIEASEDEMMDFCSKYIKNIKLKLDNKGYFCFEIPKFD